MITDSLIGTNSVALHRIEHTLPSSSFIITSTVSLPFASSFISFSFSPPSSPPIQNHQNSKLISTKKTRKYRTINTNIIDSTKYNKNYFFHKDEIVNFSPTLLEEKKENIENESKKVDFSVEKDLFDQITVRIC